MSIPDFEKLGAFYLGKIYDRQQQRLLEDLLLYDSKDLTTHGLCVGMTGSGKTGLCIGLLEEAAIDGIPSIIIDPKGDMGNLMLTFPELKAENFLPWIDPDEAARKGFSPVQYAAKTADLWRKGLEQWGQKPSRISMFRNAADVIVFTPGSQAGVPISVLNSLAAPALELTRDADALRDRVLTAVSGLLSLLGIAADPIKSREHILISNLLHQSWSQHQSLDIAGLIRAIQSPPFHRIGVFDLESFFPEKERLSLAMQLNNLLASPGFGAWLEGESLEIGKMLYTAKGRPQISIFSIAHLSDSERMFFVTLLLNEVIGWMRSQPGTTSLRAILYMDEIFGYFPPTAVPPSKLPMLTLLKQARAYGLGVLLATQNPVDLDYKGLANTGTWFIGRLQTERDKERVLDGLEGASTASGHGFIRSEMDAVLSSLGKRVFLMHNVHDAQPSIFQTRWALSYLRGPLTREQIQRLMQPKKDALTPPKSPMAGFPIPAPDQSMDEERTTAGQSPVLPSKVEEAFLPVSGALGPQDRLVYRPALLGQARLHFISAREKIDKWSSLSLLSPLSRDEEFTWEEATEYIDHDVMMTASGDPTSVYAALPELATKAASYTAWKSDLKNYLYRRKKLTLLKSPLLRQISKPGESENDFRSRLAQIAREKRDLEKEKLRRKYTPKLERVQERLRKARLRVSREQSQYGQQKIQTAISLGATVLGALFGRKVASTGNIGRATTTMRGLGRSAREKQDIARARQDVRVLQEKMMAMEADFKEELTAIQENLNPELLDLVESQISPRKSDISLAPIKLIWTPWRMGPEGLAEPIFAE